MSEQAPAVPAEAPAQHPIRLVVDDDLVQSRLTVFFRLLLVIPHLLWLTLWTIVAFVVGFVGWIVAIFMGRLPDGIHNFLAAWDRYLTHVSAYLFIVARPYPGFTGQPGYSVDVAIDPPARQNRLTIIFRSLLAIPDFSAPCMCVGSRCWRRVAGARRSLRSSRLRNFARIR